MTSPPFVRLSLKFGYQPIILRLSWIQFNLYVFFLGNYFVTSEVWCQLDLPGIFGYYLFMEHGAKLKSLSESCSAVSFLRIRSKTVSWQLLLMEVKSNQCCGTYCCGAHCNIIKTIGKPTKQTNPNLEIINHTNNLCYTHAWAKKIVNHQYEVPLQAWWPVLGRKKRWLDTFHC